MSINDLVINLAEASGLEDVEIKHALYVIGYGPEVFDLQLILALVDKCSVRFQRMEGEFPNLDAVFRGFRTAKVLKESALKVTVRSYAAVKENENHEFLRELAAKSAWFAASQTSSTESKIEVSDAERERVFELDWIAVHWFFHAVKSVYYRELSEGYQKALAENLKFREASFGAEIYTSENSIKYQVLTKGIASLGFVTWLQCMEGIWTADEHSTNSKSVLNVRALHTESLDIDGSTHNKVSQADEEPPGPLPRLSDRQQQKNYWYFPRPAEQKTIQIFFKKKFASKDSPSGGFYETLLLAMAVWMGRDVASILKLHVYGLDKKNEEPAEEEYLKVVKTGHSYSIFWKRKKAGERNAYLQAAPPEPLAERLLRLVRHARPSFVLDLLPPSHEPWSERCYRLLAQDLSCSNNRVRLILRDYLVRLVFFQTTDATFQTVWRDDPNRPENRSIILALSHYIQINKEEGNRHYLSAIDQIFGTSKGAFLEIEFDKKTKGIHFLRSVVLKLSDHYNLAEGIQEIHNSLVAYTLLACLAATAHRRSSTPFFYPWDFSLDLSLAFISDKQVVGSEARFVPIPPVVNDLVTNYVEHLRAVAVSPSVSTEVRVHSAFAQSFFTSASTSKLTPSASEIPHNLGLFFFIDEQTGRPFTASTNGLENFLGAMGLSLKVKSLRSDVAQYLSDASVGGRSVQAFLGHQPEHHAFGAESSWKVMDWAEKLRPILQAYVTHCGFTRLQLRLQTRTRGLSSKGVIKTAPMFGLSNSGYEGRMRLSQWAMSRAQKLVKTAFDDAYLNSDNFELTDADRKKLELSLIDVLAGDRKAQDKVRQEIAKYLEQLRRRGKVNISSSKANQLRLEPGPVEIGFSRWLRIAEVMRTRWISQVGQPIGSSTLDVQERIAQVVVCLVIFDAVLCTSRLRAIVKALIAGQGFNNYRDTLLIRATVTTDRYRYTTTVEPTEITSALLLGLSSVDGDDPVEPVGETAQSIDIEKQVQKVLLKVFGRSLAESGWSLSRLCTVFQPYWYLRLPGAVYAISKGDHCGPATDFETEQALYDEVEPNPRGEFVWALTKSTSGGRTRKSDQKMAYEALYKLFVEASGRVSAGTARNRWQRGQLRSILSSNANAELNAWRARQVVVDFMFQFIVNMFEEGGARKGILNFNSIAVYFSRVAPVLIAEAWDQNFEDWTSEDYSRFYERVESKLPGSKSNSQRTALRRFHRFMRDFADAPPCDLVYTDYRLPSNIRGSLVTADGVNRALQALHVTDTGDSVLAGHARVLVATSYGYGLRRNEALGLDVKAFDTEKAVHLAVKRGQISDLKTTSSRRHLGASANSKTGDQIISAATKRAIGAPEDRRRLFDSGGGDDLIANDQQTAALASAALRWCSGNAALVPHSLRHTFATRLCTLALCPSPQRPSTKRIYNRLVGDLTDSHVLKEILQLPRNWPFAIGAISQAMGHAGTDTLLDTYFHGASWVMAEYTSRDFGRVELEDARVAAMLNKDRSVITKLRAKLSARQVSSDRGSLSAVVGFYLIQSYARPRLMEGQKFTEDLMMPTRTGSQAVQWAIFDRLLRQRAKEGWSLSGMLQFAVAEMHISATAAQGFVDAYRQVVTILGFDDFEPVNSELITPLESHQKGMLRGTAERERFLFRVQELYEKNLDFRQHLQRLMVQWFDSVDADEPKIVLTDTEQASAALSLLGSLGASDSQIEIASYCRSSDTKWTSFLAKHPNAKRHTEGRASRGAPRAVVSELAIDVAQVIQTNVPDGRDLHRALIVIFASVGAPK